jgi:hypothetical protein
MCQSVSIEARGTSPIITSFSTKQTDWRHNIARASDQVKSGGTGKTFSPCGVTGQETILNILYFALTIFINVPLDTTETFISITIIGGAVGDGSNRGASAIALVEVVLCVTHQTFIFVNTEFVTVGCDGRGVSGGAGVHGRSKDLSTISTFEAFL